MRNSLLFRIFRFSVSAMKSYEFVSVWRVAATMDRTWSAINDYKSWPRWWPGVLDVVELEPGDDDGIGAVHRSVWKSKLPYRLEFDTRVVKIETHRLIEVEAFGELQGSGLWQFFATEGEVKIQYDWSVRTSKRWMNLIAPVARPFFEWNHDVIMGWGENGLKEYLPRI